VKVLHGVRELARLRVERFELLLVL
jgi:hypothetical protein